MFPLDATALTLFLVSAFVGGVTTGLAGFAHFRHGLRLDFDLGRVRGGAATKLNCFLEGTGGGNMVVLDQYMFSE